MSGSVNPRLSFTTSPEEKDWVSAYWLTIRNRWLWRRLCVALMLVWAVYFALVAGIDTSNFGWHPEWALGWLLTSAQYSLVVSAIVILTTIALTPRRVRKFVLDSKRLAQETHFEANDVGIESRNAISTSSLTWPQFERWLENRHVLVLMVTRSSFFIIRKSDLGPSVSEKFRSLLVAANVPNR